MKEFVYIIEVTFEAVVVKNQNTEDQYQTLELRTEVASFKDVNKSQAKQRAQDFYDRTLRYGLTRAGSSIVKSQVPAHCIKNIALLDFDKYQEEMAAMQQQSEASTGLIAPDVDATTEPAVVTTEV